VRERRARAFLRILMFLILQGCLSGGTNPASKAEERRNVAIPFIIEGFGAGAVGGYGGAILTVTNLNNDGPGSLREAVNKPGPRVIRFGVAGIIQLRSDLTVGEPYVTIDGSDAPQGGITIRDATLIIQTEQVIIRHLRVRPGVGVPDLGNGDAITVKPEGKHVVLDHVSLSWSTDETLSIYGTDVTVQWSFVTEGLNCTGHPKDFCHSKGLFLSEPSTRISVLHTLIAHHVDRNPFIRSGRTDMPNQYQFVNNIFYDYGDPTVIQTLAPAGTVQLDFVGNFYKRGPKSYGLEILLASRGLDTFRGTLSLYLLGNISPNRLRETDPENLLLSEGRRRYVATKRNFSPVSSETDAFTAFESVLSKGGAALPCRDAVDRRVADEVRHGKGQIIDRPADVGGWPSMICENGKK